MTFSPFPDIPQSHSLIKNIIHEEEFRTGASDGSLIFQQL